MNKKQLAANIMSLSVLKGFDFIIPLITLPYLVKTLGIEKFGLINFSLSFALYFGAIIQFGFGVTTSREIARSQNNIALLSRLYSVTLFASIILAVASFLFSMAIIFSYDRFNEERLIFISAVCSIIFHSLSPVWLFQGVEKMKYITYITLASRIGYLVALICFVTTANDYFLVVIFNAIASFFIFISSLSIVHFFLKIRIVQVSIDEIKHIYFISRHAFISQFSPNLYNNSTIFLLGMFSGVGAVGTYTAATKIIDALCSVGYIVSNAFFPTLSRNLNFHLKLEKIMISSALLLCVTLIFSSSFIVDLAYGEQEHLVLVKQLLSFSSISLIAVSAMLVYGTNYLMLIGKDNVVSNISLYTSLAFFAIALFFIGWIGIWGAAITLVGARSVMATLMYINFKNNTGASIHARKNN